MLEGIAPSPINTLNRSIAIAEWQDPDAGLALLEALNPPPWLLGYLPLGCDTRGAFTAAAGTATARLST